MRVFYAGLVCGAILYGAAGVGLAQQAAIAAPEPLPQKALQADSLSDSQVDSQQGAQRASQAETSRTPPAAKTWTVPAGTKVLLSLRSSINTKSAKAGDGVYLASNFPVVVGNRVLIPTGVYVQGVIDRVVRAGRVKGRAQLDLHFTSIIFPNGTVVEIPGMVAGLPGAKDHQVKNEAGTIEQDSNKGHDVGQAAKIGLQGAAIGTIAGAATGHTGEGLALGGLSGVAVGTIAALLSRGADVNIEAGTSVEMVLQRPLLLEEANLSATGAVPTVAPQPQKARTLNKPGSMKILCPPGGLGCS